MTLITDIISTKFTKYGNILLIAIVAILFIGIAIHCYYQFYIPLFRKKRFADVVNAANDVDITVYFFFTDWCPHCTSAKPEWEKFKEEYNNRAFGNYRIVCNDVNCTNACSSDVNCSSEEGKDISQIMSAYNVEYFPTIKMLKDGDTIDFDAKVNFSNLSKLVDTVLE